MKNLLIARILSLTTTGIITILTGCQATPQPSEATISKSRAEATALSRVKGGKVQEGELETEGGKLVWSFDISRPGIRGIREIQVDAKTGAVVSEKDETAIQESAEAASPKKHSH